METQRSFTMTDGGAVAGGREFNVLNPATGGILAAAPDCSRQQLDAAVAAASRAFAGWKATPMQQRREALRAIGTKLFENADPLMRLLTAEQGKPHAKAVEDVMGAGYWCHQLASLSLPAELNEDGAERRSETRRVPIGVVAAIVNDTPFGLAAGVWSSDTDSAAALGERLEVGTVWINESRYMNPMLPFGGHKQSGIGVENARDGLPKFTNTQVLVVRKMPAAA